MDLFNCKFIFTFQLDICVERCHLCKDVICAKMSFAQVGTCANDIFYSFCYKPLSRQHPVNATFFQLKCMLVVFLFVCLFNLLVNGFEMY